MSLSRWFGLSGCSLGAAAFVLPLSCIHAQEERELVIQAVVVGEKGEKEEKEEEDDDDEKQPGYWIGIGLEGDGGTLKIAEVYPESPALSAGLKSGDILLAVDGNALKNLEQLVDAIQDSKGKTLKVRFTREGKEQVAEVKPTKRPGAVAIVEREEKEEKKEKGEKKEGNAFKSGQPGIEWRIVGDPQKPGSGSSGGSGTMHLFTAPKGAPGSPPSGGGSAFPPGVPWGQGGGNPGMMRMTIAAPQAQLPDDMEVSISKKGNKPAVVVAKQGDKLWKTTESELGMLPPQAQAYASRLLGKDVIRAKTRSGGNPGMGGGMMMQGMSGGMGMPGMPGMGGMPGMPAMGMKGTGAAPAREMRRIELRLDKDGKVQGVEGTKTAPQVKALPGGGFQVEIHEGKEEKSEGKSEKKESKPAASKEETAKAERIRVLQLEAEQLRELLNKLREQVKEREKVEEKK